MNYGYLTNVCNFDVEVIETLEIAQAYFCKIVCVGFDIVDFYVMTLRCIHDLQCMRMTHLLVVVGRIRQPKNAMRELAVLEYTVAQDSC